MSTNYIIKILTLGATQVGKTSIVLRYSEDKFNYNKIATIGIDFKIKIIKKGNERIKVSIYDTAGQERFQNIVKHYYKGANGVLLIYDITKRDTFKNLDFWIKDLEDNSDKREVSWVEASNYAKEKKLPYIEVSAKTGNNIQKLFDEVIKGAMTKMLTNENKDNSLNESIRLSFLEQEERTPKKYLCC